MIQAQVGLVPLPKTLTPVQDCLSHTAGTQAPPSPDPTTRNYWPPVFFLTFPSAFIEPSCHSLCKKKSKEQEPRGQTVPLSGHLAWQCCPPHGGFLLGTWALSPLTLMESFREAVVRVALQLGVGVTGSVLGALGPALPPEIPEGPLSGVLPLGTGLVVALGGVAVVWPEFLASPVPLWSSPGQRSLCGKQVSGVTALSQSSPARGSPLGRAGPSFKSPAHAGAAPSFP